MILREDKMVGRGKRKVAGSGIPPLGGNLVAGGNGGAGLRYIAT